MARENLQTEWAGFLNCTGQRETYQRMTVDEQRAFVDGWEGACYAFAVHHDGEQIVGSGNYTFRAIRSICEQARADIDSNARRQQQLRREILAKTAKGNVS